MEKLRQLVACPSCQRQFDASGHAAGERFHCLCGELVEVPAPQPHDAAVVRCSACGGPRQGDEAACSFCGSDFTLHERDLHTLCPGCATRISDRARYCHACALPIAPEGELGDPTEHDCPVCGDASPLASRQIGARRMALLECGRCGGLWLGSDVFKELEEEALRRAPVDATGPATPAAATSTPPSPAAAPFYRPCPVCDARMHRRNYGRKSGVILDTCAAHGLWFDHGELARVLGWIREGGSRRAEAAADEQRRAEARRPATPGHFELEAPRTRGGLLVDLLRHLGEVLF